MRDLPWEMLLAAGALAAALAGVWQWRQGLDRQMATPAAAESWQHVRERHPMPAPFKLSGEVSEALLRSVVRANPFSPARRQTAQDAGGGSSAPALPAAPPPPQFVFKGRILMGTKQRAVLEDVTTKKTHFLQVGQGVAGFKVLDITETEVVLSLPNTEEPLRIKKETFSSSESGTRAP